MMEGLGVTERHNLSPKCEIMPETHYKAEL